MSKYVIIDAESIQNRIEELENTEALDRQDGIEIYKEIYVLKQILSQSTPLITEIEKTLEQAKAMHKEEIEDALLFGDVLSPTTAENYYNKTFGGNNEQQ